MAQGKGSLSLRTALYALGAAALLLVLTVVLLIAILMSAAFLSGVYGAFGRAASTFSITRRSFGQFASPAALRW